MEYSTGRVSEAPSYGTLGVRSPDMAVFPYRLGERICAFGERLSELRLLLLELVEYCRRHVDGEPLECDTRESSGKAGKNAHRKCRDVDVRILLDDLKWTRVTWA